MICSTGTSQDWMPHSPALILLMYHHYYYIKDDTEQSAEHHCHSHHQSLIASQVKKNSPDFATALHL